VILLARHSRDFWRTKKSGPRETDLLIMTANPQMVREGGLTLAVSPYRINTASPLAGIKTLNYLDHVLSWEEAQEREFDEAVMVNERGEIGSATLANIFWVKEGTVHTPTLNTGANAGVTRAALMEIASANMIPVVEGAYDLTHLTDADEIFLTSSSLGVALISTFDFRQYSPTPDSLSVRLRNEYEKLSVG
jgi:branched-subunit amino acid aminotransferase/4-amino-4-deoxychorismate lyase